MEDHQFRNFQYNHYNDFRNLDNRVLRILPVDGDGPLPPEVNEYQKITNSD